MFAFYAKRTAQGVALFALVIVVLVLLWAGFKVVKRSQQRADAANQVRVQNTLIRATQAAARRRFEESKGIRAAQDEIARTLTPLYVQHEAIQKLPQARAIYVPSGAQGIPQVFNVAPTTEGK